MALIFLFACRSVHAQSKGPLKVTIHVDPGTQISEISPNFIGFGYETSAVAQPDFFSGSNKKMIRLFRNLSTQGMIRVGGIISDHTDYVPGGAAVPWSMENTTIISRKSLKKLNDFARATGWSVMWGLNLKTNSKQEAAIEAAAVANALGDHLYSFEIGNEIDFFSQFSKDYGGYYQSYRAYKKAIRNKVPQASFSGPDVAWNVDWLEKFAETQSNDLKLLTHHYYRGSASDSTSTMQKLLQPDSSWHQRLEKLRKISKKEGVPYRINETNSFSGGGRLGVSDAFGSALWCLDYLFVLASHGSEGVNLETSINQHAWISHYSPIARTTSGTYTIRPEYYSMLAFSIVGNGQVVKLDMSKTPVNMTAYATKSSKKYLWITIINKDFTRNAAVNIYKPKGYSAQIGLRLKAPSLKSKTKVTLGGTQVTDDGKWNAKDAQKISVKNGIAQLNVPHASAVLVRFKH